MHLSISTNLEKLSPHPPGSIKELLHVSMPLIISYLSVYLMIFMHRLVLSKSSIEEMNAAATIGLVCFIFDYGLSGIIAIVEVLIGKLNGARQYHAMGKPVWQAIWLCVFSSFICIPLAYFGCSFLVPQIYQPIGTNYYMISLITCPIFGLGVALSCFFIGQGKNYIITIAVVISNILNFILLLFLVFGIWIFPKLGLTGAAIATLCAQITQVLILAIAFFSKNNRIYYGCNLWQFNYKIFKQMVILGVPNSLSHMLELSAWAIISRMLASISNTQVTLFNVGQSIFILLAFFSEGLQKGVIAIVSNLIGANQKHLIPKSIVSANYILMCFCIVLFFIILIANDYIIKLFFSHPININCLWVLLYFMLESLAWIRTAVLIAFSDVKFIMTANITSILLFAVLPVYVFIVKGFGSELLSSWQIISFSALINLLVFYYRSKHHISTIT